MIKNQKGSTQFLIILTGALVIILTIGFLAFKNEQGGFISPKISDNTPARIPDKTAGWQTYVDTNLNISFDYPKDWIVGKHSQNEYPWYLFLRPLYPAPEDTSYGLVSISVTDTNLDLEEYLNKLLCESSSSCSASEKSADLEIGEIKAKKITNHPGPINSEAVIFKKDDSIFTIRVALDRSYEETYTLEDKKQIYNQILSTFIFAE